MRKRIRDRIAAAPATARHIRGGGTTPAQCSRAGKIGGARRAAALSPERRREISALGGRTASANRAASMVLVRRHPLTHLPTCLLLPPDVTPHLTGPLTNCAAVTRSWVEAERERIHALLAG